MPDHDQLVDQIRAFVQSADQTKSPALEALATAYAEACGEVGRRLSKCQGLLRQGLRSEAIQLAETAPRLLDQVAALDFPERAAWDELVQIYDLLPAPPIPVESAAFLNEAYAEEDPLQELLRSHRRLALARAPLSERISVLRRLATLDPNNPVWPEDLQTFERARFGQIESESAQAGKAGDAAAVARLLDELTGQPWSEPPPDSVLTPLKRLNAKLQGARKLEQFTEFERRLGEAFAARDSARGRIARKNWLQLAESMGLRPGDPRWDRAEAALRWLDQEDAQAAEDQRREAVFDELEALLDAPGRAPSRELERLADELGGLRENLPGGLAERFQARLTLELAREARRRKAIIAGATAAVLLVAAGIGIAYRNHARSGRAVRAATAVADMLDLGELDRAVEFVDTLTRADAAVVEAPEFHEARGRLKIEQEKEVARALEFDKALRLADQAPTIEEEPEALKTARKLARLDAEKAAVEQRAAARRDVALAERSRLEESLSPRIQAVDDQANQLIADYRRGANTGDPSRFLEPLTRLQNECRNLGAEARGVGGELRDRLQAITTRVNDFGAEFDRDRRLATIEDQLTMATNFAPGAVFNPDHFADVLGTYAKSLADSAEVEQVDRVRNEARIWKAVVAWGRLVDRWSKEGTDLDPKRARDRLDDCSKFLNDHPMAPMVKTIEEYKASLEVVAARGEADAQLPVGRLRALLADSMIDAIWMVQVRREVGPGAEPEIDSYYLARKPREGSNLLQYIENFDGRERSRAIVLQFIKYSDWSPQTKFASRYKPKLSTTLTETQWDEMALAMLAEIRDDPLMDPLLKMVLLKKIGEAASAGSMPSRVALEATLAALANADIDTNVPWMDPTSTTPDKLRPRADALIKSLPDLASVARSVQEERLRTDRMETATPRTVGWLARRGGAWTLRAGKSSPRDAVLWTTAPIGDGAKSIEKQVGAIQNGAPTIDAADDDALAEGRPVFVWSR